MKKIIIAILLGMILMLLGGCARETIREEFIAPKISEATYYEAREKMVGESTMDFFETSIAKEIKATEVFFTYEEENFHMYALSDSEYFEYKVSADSSAKKLMNAWYLGHLEDESLRPLKAVHAYTDANEIKISVEYVT